MTVKTRAYLIGFNADLMMAFSFDSFTGCFDVRKTRVTGYAARTITGLFPRTDC